MPADPWMTSEQAAQRLGVKPATLYAYVSRGLVRSERTPGDRRSRFLRADVERLAARQRSGGRAGALDIVVETELTLLDPSGRLAYRGWDVEDAVREAGFEEVATWLLTGERRAARFPRDDALVAAGLKVTRAMPGAPLLDLLRAAVAAMRWADPLRHDRRASAVARTAGGLVAAMVDVLPLTGDAPPVDATIARALWPRLTAVPATKRRVDTLDAVLVLLADHELAASTLAARVTASTWADAYLVVLAGLAALGGPLHGGASTGARELIRSVVERRASAAQAIDQRLRDGQLIPGFGHRVYASRDPRAEILFELLDARGAVARAGRELVDVMRDRGLPFANIDFTLALLAESHDLLPDAVEATFAISRTIGWLAHATEEYEHRLRFRPRAAYIGPAPPP